ncbi:PREDICTED: facilitated trehalose transporter Tret1-2 homolog [Nicrophorus vespilloides]|uniref:Facilitated trehalose transporter Tret1-2 homolog n=1 Tax=Nicrophorus vespilloides TaxID=110193 RepID=A0ABM1NH33_NICVS|nr:PREDICTED: facilitated trehalose transporter Tret1-2 homolog [Nicrophorus vespilloides]
MSQHIAALLVSLSAFSIGTCLSWTGVIRFAWEPTDAVIAVGQIAHVGAVIGALGIGPFCQRIGPRRILQLVAFPLFGSWLIVAFCATTYGLYLGRFLAGLNLGAVCVAAPTYVAELCEAKYRGSLLSSFFVQLVLGKLFGLILGASIEDPKLLALAFAIVPVACLICVSFVPESPLHLTSEGELEDAKISLQWLRDPSKDVDGELLDVADSLTVEPQVKIALKKLSIVLGLVLIQALCGAPLVFLKLATSISMLLDVRSSFLYIVITYVNQAAASLVCVQLIDRCGRRILLVLSTLLTYSSLMALGLFVCLDEPMSIPNLVFPITTCLFAIGFSIGLGPILWVFAGELFGARTKSWTVPIVVATYWSLDLLALKSETHFNQLFLEGDPMGVLVSALLCFFSIVFIYFCVPETNGKSIKEIDDLFIKDKIQQDAA